MARHSHSVQNRSARRRRVAILMQRAAMDAPTPEVAAASIEHDQPQNKLNPAPEIAGNAFSIEYNHLQTRIRQPEAMTWVFAGDLRFYTTSVADESLPRRIEDHTRTTLGRDADIFVNATYSGARLNHVHKRIQIRFSQFRPDVVVVLCGFAECQTGVEKCSDFEASFIALLREIENAGAIPIICTPPHSDVTADAEGHIDRLIFIEAIRGCVAEQSGILIDFWEDWENQDQSSQFWSSATGRPTQLGLQRMLNRSLHQLGMLPAGRQFESTSKNSTNTASPSAITN